MRGTDMTVTRKRLHLSAAVITAGAMLVVGLTTADAQAAAPAPSDPTTHSAIASGAGMAAAPTGAWTAGGLIAGATPPQSQALSSNGFAQVGGCTFYASSSSAGGYCSTGGVTGVAQSLQAWLAGRTFYACRFFPMPEGMEVNAPSPPGGQWMMKACFKNYHLDQPWGGQSIDVEVFGQWVENGDDIRIPGYMEQFWGYQADRHYYPLPRLNIGPSQPARVGSYTFFWATWLEALDTTKVTKPEFRVPYNTISAGTVYLHAKISDVTIQPGVDGMDDVVCGPAETPFDTEADTAIPKAEGGDQESDCYTIYTHSSASEENQTVPIRATATWHVQVENAAGNPIAQLGDFRYSVTQRLRVGEVQTLSDW